MRNLRRCIENSDQTVTVYVGSNDHFVYRLDAAAIKTLKGTAYVEHVFKLELVTLCYFDKKSFRTGGIKNYIFLASINSKIAKKKKKKMMPAAKYSY